MAIRLQNNGKYLVNIRDNTGKRLKRTFRTKKDATAFESSIKLSKYEEHLIKNGIKKSRYLVNQAMEDYLLTKRELRPRSLVKYKYVIGELKKFIEPLNIKYVDEFSPDNATSLFNELVKEKEINRGKKKVITKSKPKTVNFFLSFVRAFFQQEYIKQHIVRNPMLHIKNLKVEKRNPEYFSKDELIAFFAQEMDPSYRTAFMGLLFTGMRFGELANLHWTDVDFISKLIHIKSKGNFRTKTFNSERAIPINKILFDELKNVYSNKLSDIYVFTSAMGYQLRERKLLAVCKKIAKNASIPGNAFLHKFRHTYATMLVQNGTSIQNIKELLGHWSVIETERYAHNMSDHLHQDVGRLDQLLTV